MNNLVAVKTDISECDRGFNVVLGFFDELDKVFKNISTCMDDTTKWDGKIHDKCVDIHKLIDEYAKAIRPICVDLQKHINDLTKNAGDFAHNSYCVEKLKIW